jgi:hypothetical protein
MKIQGVVCFVVMLLAGGSLALGDTSRFEGHWIDTQSRGIAALEIRSDGATLRFHVYGRCHPQDCDWGEVPAQTYAPGAGQEFKDTVEALSAEYLTSFSRVLLVVYPVEGDRLRVETFTVFRDSTGRLPYHVVQTIERSAVAHVANSVELTQPVQLSPPGGSVFSVFPRTTTVQWSVVPAATRYGVEVDCYDCCQAGKWCSEVGGKIRSAVVDGLTYTFDFAGAQPGRWRVWAIGPGGEAGPKTNWRGFRYTR